MWAAETAGGSGGRAGTSGAACASVCSMELLLAIGKERRSGSRQVGEKACEMVSLWGGQSAASMVGL